MAIITGDTALAAGDMLKPITMAPAAGTMQPIKNGSGNPDLPTLPMAEDGEEDGGEEGEEGGGTMQVQANLSATIAGKRLSFSCPETSLSSPTPHANLSQGPTLQSTLHPIPPHSFLCLSFCQGLQEAAYLAQMQEVAQIQDVGGPPVSYGCDRPSGQVVQLPPPAPPHPASRHPDLCGPLPFEVDGQV